MDRSADALVHEMVRLRDEVIPVVPAMVPGEVIERPVGVECENPKCGRGVLKRRRGKAIEKEREDGSRRWVCSRCGQAWKTKRRVVAVRGSRRGSAPHEESIFLVARIERVLASLPLWMRRTLVGYVHLERLQSLVRNLAAEGRARRQALRDFEEALGRASAWERKLVGACAQVLATAADDGAIDSLGLRKAEILSDAFRKAFPRASGAPTSSYAVKKVLLEARQMLEKRWGKAA